MPSSLILSRGGVANTSNLMINSGSNNINEMTKSSRKGKIVKTNQHNPPEQQVGRPNPRVAPSAAMCNFPIRAIFTMALLTLYI